MHDCAKDQLVVKASAVLAGGNPLMSCLTGQWLRKYIYSHTAEGTVTVVILARGPSPFLLVLAWLRNMHLETTFPSLPCKRAKT